MRIVYSPFYSGNYYINPQKRPALDIQILETRGLLDQLAMHAGIHQQIPSYPKRLASYHKALLKYDDSDEGNIFHRSIKIDSISVAKTLLRWRDSLALCGWSKDLKLNGCSRLNYLAEIDGFYEDDGVAALLRKVASQVQLMETDKLNVPEAIKNLVIEIPCRQDLLPDYIKPLLTSLVNLGAKIEDDADDEGRVPKCIKEIHFPQQWKAEAWLTKQLPADYNAWINTDNKRLDNWLHMAGNQVCGSVMTATNPQITQMFLLAIQLFQRPLNANTLLQYLFLPECPLEKKLGRRLARVIAKEGGFCNEKVQECINNYIVRELKAEGDKTPQESTQKEREENYSMYLPFDLRNEDSALSLVEESDVVDTKVLTTFLEVIGSYASDRAKKVETVQPFDARIAQLNYVAEMMDALLEEIGKLAEGELSFAMLSQWAQSLYENGDFTLYHAQVGCRNVINQPGNMIDEAEKTIWCDFYGDVKGILSTDFLSNHEMEQLEGEGVRLWNRKHESDFMNLMIARPVHKTTGELTIITCDQQGTTNLPTHPLYRQLPFITEQIDGEALYKEMASREIEAVENHRESDDDVIRFDAEEHPVRWRNVESFSALEKLLQNPFDYFMNYTLGFTDVNEIEINIFKTYGNVAHEVVEMLFTADREGASLAGFVSNNYERAYRKALVKKGALLLLPEHHLDKERLRYLLRGCADKLATIIEENGLTVIECEKKEQEDLKFEGGIILEGYIDMLLCDKAGNDVVFDLKYALKKDKYKDVLKDNRALQLAIYKAMLEKQKSRQSVRTAYFVMPYGKLFSTDEFIGDNCEHITPRIKVEVMKQVRNGYAERVKEIKEGRIETADNKPILDIEYARAENVYPLDQIGRRILDEATGKNKVIKFKVENKYSDYKSFTI